MSKRHRHPRCQQDPGHTVGSSQALPAEPGSRLCWVQVPDSPGVLTGRGCCSSSRAFSCPSQPCCTTGCSRARSVLTQSTCSPHSPCLVWPRWCRAAVLWVATTAGAIAAQKHISLQVCLLIPAGCVSVCVYRQQIPHPDLSFAVTNLSMPWAWLLQRPVFLHPSPLPCPSLASEAN